MKNLKRLIKRFGLDVGFTFNASPFLLTPESIGGPLIREHYESGFKEILNVFSDLGYLGFVYPHRSISGKRNRYRIGDIADNPETEETSAIANGKIHTIFFADYLYPVEDYAPLNLALNISERRLHKIRMDRRTNHYPRRLINFQIRDGDEFNLVVRKMGKEGDFIADFSSKHRAIIKDSSVPLKEESSVRVKVLRARGTQFFVKAVSGTGAQNGETCLELTRERQVA